MTRDELIFLIVRSWVRLRYPGAHRFQRKVSPGGFDIARPATINEKYYWRKIFDRDPRFPVISDKLAVKDFVRAICPDLKVPEVLWVGERARDIPAHVLTGNVVVKTNDACHTNFMIHEGAVDREKMVAQVNQWLRMPAYGRSRGEWAYCKIARKVFVERMVGSRDTPVFDFKVYLFAGTPVRVVCVYDRLGTDRAAAYDFDENNVLKRSKIKTSVSARRAEDPLPPITDELLDISSKLGAGFDHIRVDFLTDGEAFWLGELTLYNLGGFVSDLGNDPTEERAVAWDIRQSHFLRHPPRWGWRAIYARALKRYMVRTV